MKLLLDENLSSRLVDVLAAEFPGTTHIELLGLRGCDTGQRLSRRADFSE